MVLLIGVPASAQPSLIDGKPSSPFAGGSGPTMQIPQRSRELGVGERGNKQLSGESVDVSGSHGSAMGGLAGARDLRKVGARALRNMLNATAWGFGCAIFGDQRLLGRRRVAREARLVVVVWRWSE